jgi:glycine dehydrogenase subunit 2
MIRGWLRSRGEGEKRTRVIVPDSAHRTNPASVHLVGYETVTIASEVHATVSLEALKRALDDRAAAVMLTVPNTLGLFEPNIVEVTRLAHAAGAQVYLDGANLNALVGLVRPGDLGFDLMHINVHKTFSSPTGGGSQGAGPVRRPASRAFFLYRWWKKGGQATSRVGSPAIDLPRPFASRHFRIAAAGAAHLEMARPACRVSRTAILGTTCCAAHRTCKLPRRALPSACCQRTSAALRRENADVAKRLLDFGVHAPTVISADRGRGADDQAPRPNARP